MAADTENAAPAPPAAADAAPAAENGAAAAPTSMAGVRSILGQGMRAHAAKAAGLFPTKDAAPLAPPPGNGVVSGQQADTPPAAAPVAQPEMTSKDVTPAAQTREVSPPTTSTTPPTDAAAAPPQRAETPPQPQAPQPAPPASPDQPIPSTPPARSDRPELPPEYATREYQDRFAADPLLRRNLLGIWGQPELSDVAKARAMEKQVDASDKRMAAARSAQDRLTQLRRSGNLQEWAKQVELTEAQEAYRQQWAQGVTQLLARTLGADPTDEGFANAGAIQPGESEELRAVRFAEWAVANSPVGRAHLATLTAALQAEHEAQIAQIRAEHEEALKSQRSRLEQEAAATAAAALAQGRGTQTAFPPRAPGAAADGTERGASPSPTDIRGIRGLIGAGLRLRQEAARPTAN